jgi:Glycosyl hydrolase family 79 C-terminal beta domain
VQVSSPRDAGVTTSCALRRFVVALSLLLLVACGGLGAATACAYESSLSVAGTTVARPLPHGFLGIAIRFDTVTAWEPGGSAPPNPVLSQLIRSLNPIGRPSIRIGGDSTDRSWWPTPGVPQPLGVTETLGPAWGQSLKQLALSTNAKLLLGLNLEANRARLDQNEAHQYLKVLGRHYIGALEIGNEPDLYPLIPWYKLVDGKVEPWYVHGGTPVFARRRTYGPTEFGHELARTLAVLPKLPEAGPETGHPEWVQQFIDVVRPRGLPMTLTSHAYGLNRCVKDPASRSYPTVSHLLTLFASRENMLHYDAPYIALAHADGGSFRVDEMGSVTCHGRVGVSNTMASALWALDALFYLDSQDVDGVNLHSYPGSSNGLFDFTHVKGIWDAAVHPLYYGALMFAQAAPEGSRLLAVQDDALPQLRAWSTLGTDHKVRVLLINDSLRSAGQITVHSPAGWGSRAASIERLLAPSATAATDITLGGQSFAPGTDGRLPAPQHLTVSPRRGAYTLTMAPSTAALLTLSPAP